MVLSMHGAQEVDARTAPDLYRLVQELAGRAGLPMPRVYIIDNPQPNAFATGRNPEHAAVAVTTGLLNTLSREEVAGVIAHELAHIKNRDTLIMTITATIAGAISMLAQFGMFFGGNRDNNNGMGIIGTLAMVILAPIAAMLVQMAISRTREYAADRMGARDRRRAALSRLRARQASTTPRTQIPNEQAERNPATAHMFIINPLSGQRMDNLFSTHPATENRIAALEQLAARDGPRRLRASARAPRQTRSGARSVGRRSAAVRGAKRAIKLNRHASASLQCESDSAAVRASGRRSAGKRTFMTPARRDSARRSSRSRRPPHRRRHPRQRAAPPSPARRASSTARTRIRALRRSPIATARWCASWSRPCCAASARCAICSANSSNADFPTDAPRVETALLIGAAQILFLDVPDHAAVDLSVRLVQADRRAAQYPGLINAVLRRVTREGRTLLADARCRAARHAGLAVRALAQDLRRRHRARDRDRARPRAAARSHGEGRCRELGAAPARPRAADRHACAPPRRADVALLPGYHEGAWWVQDAAAALPARLFGDVARQAASPTFAPRPAARPRSLRKPARASPRSTARPTGWCACATISRGSACTPT